MKNIKRNNNFFLITLFILLLIVGCKNSDNSTINDGATIINVGGVNREYVIYIPSTYDSIDTVPLMLIFHGWTMSANDQMNISDMRDLSETEQFILVYPQGTVFHLSLIHI